MTSDQYQRNQTSASGEPRQMDGWPHARMARTPGSPAPAVPMDGDVLSCILYIKPGLGGEVAERVERFAGVQVHAGAELDKLVVTVEDIEGHKASDMLGALGLVEGVINSILVYHCTGQAFAAAAFAAAADEQET